MFCENMSMCSVKACAFGSFLCNVHHNVDHSRLGFVELGHVATCSYKGSAQKHLIGLEYYCLSKSLSFKRKICTSGELTILKHLSLQPSSVVTENKSAQELAAIVVGVSVTVALLLTTAVTVISVALCVIRRTRMNNLLTTSTNVAYQSRGGHNTHHNLPLPLLPFQTDSLPTGALQSNQDPPLGAVRKY